MFLIDSSGSVSDEDVQHQREAFRNALRSPNVYSAIQNNFHQKIAIQLIEYGSGQFILRDWVAVSSHEDLENLSNSITDDPRVIEGSTNTGAAMKVAYSSIFSNSMISKRRVINVIIDDTADDRHNAKDVLDIIAESQDFHFNINGLAIIRNDLARRMLPSHFRKYIITGPRSFYTEFTYEAIEEILVKNIQYEMF